MMPSPSAWRPSAFQRPVLLPRMELPGKNLPPPIWFRYSQIIGESNRAEPSSSTKAGILPRGLILRNSILPRVEISNSSILRPSSRATTRTFREKGEGGLKYSFICFFLAQCRTDLLAPACQGCALFLALLMPLERDQGMHRLTQLANAFGAAQFRQVDDKGTADHIGAGAFQQRDPGDAGAAGGDQIIDNQHIVTLGDGIDVNLHPVLAIFQIVILADHGMRQLAFLADGNKADRQLMGDSPAQNESPRLYSRHLVDTPAG